MDRVLNAPLTFWNLTDFFLSSNYWDCWRLCVLQEYFTKTWTLSWRKFLSHICSAKQWTGFYMTGTSAMKEVTGKEVRSSFTLIFFFNHPSLISSKFVTPFQIASENNITSYKPFVPFLRYCRVTCKKFGRNFLSWRNMIRDFWEKIGWFSSQVFYKIIDPKNLPKFTGKHFQLSSF